MSSKWAVATSEVQLAFISFQMPDCLNAGVAEADTLSCDVIAMMLSASEHVLT